MPERARVTSLEAIESFRAKLIIYRTRAGSALDEASDEVTRARLWLENDRQTFWKQQIRRLTHELEQRQQELFSARLSDLRDSSQLQQVAVQKAKLALREAEEKRHRAVQWHRQFDQKVGPMARQVDKLRHHLGHDLGLAVAWLSDLTRTLSAYAEMSPAGNGVSTAPAPSENPVALANPSNSPEGVASS